MLHYSFFVVDIKLVACRQLCNVSDLNTVRLCLSRDSTVGIATSYGLDD
jgi:hypothetical protein